MASGASPARQTTAAATIGTPGGASGTIASATAAPASAASSSRRSRTWPAEQGEEQRGERGVEPERLGSPSTEPASDAGDRADDPRGVDRHARADQQPRVVAPAAAVADRPRLVDGDLALRGARSGAARQPRRDRQPDRQVARVEQQRRDDRGDRGAAVVDDRHGRELRRAGEGQDREDDGRDGGESGLPGEHAVGQPEAADGDRQRPGAAGALRDRSFAALASTFAMPNEIVKVVGDNLRRLRTEQGLSLSDLARSSGVAKATLSARWRAAAATRRSRRSRALAAALQIPMGDLITAGRSPRR